VGIPVRVTVGKNYFQGCEIEVKLRSSGDVEKVRKDDIVGHLHKIIEAEMSRFRI